MALIKHRNLGSLPDGLVHSRWCCRGESAIMDNPVKDGPFGYHQDYSPYRTLASGAQMVHTIDMRLPLLTQALEVAAQLSANEPGEEGALVCFEWNGRMVQVTRRSDLALLSNTVALSRSFEVGPYPLWLTFDDALAKLFKPVYVIKHARFVGKADHATTVIKAEWGERQTLVGSYYEIYNPETGKVKYGSAFDEWIATNTQLGNSTQWYKSAPVRAYPSPIEGWLETVLADGTVETHKFVHPGDWVVKQAMGEVMCLGAQKFPTLYDVSSAH